MAIGMVNVFQSTSSSTYFLLVFFRSFALKCTFARLQFLGRTHNALHVHIDEHSTHTQKQPYIILYVVYLVIFLALQHFHSYARYDSII